MVILSPSAGAVKGVTKGTGGPVLQSALLESIPHPTRFLRYYFHSRISAILDRAISISLSTELPAT